MPSNLTGRIVEWNGPRGFGYLVTQDQRLFLHIRDFAERHKRPEVGDMIRFTIGTDPKGRVCAREAVHVNDGGRITYLNLIVLAVLVLAPLIALYRLAPDPRLASAYAVVVAALTYKLYAYDKQCARENDWRTPETLLHVLELIGGWPGAFIAQRRLRHKCAKGSFQITFWLIVLAYQFIAIDSFMDWRLSKSALGHLDSKAKALRHQQ